MFERNWDIMFELIYGTILSMLHKAVLCKMVYTLNIFIKIYVVTVFVNSVKNISNAAIKLAQRGRYVTLHSI